MTDTERLHALRGILTMITEDIETQARQMAELGWSKDEAAESVIAWWKSNLNDAINLARELLR